VPLLSRTLVDQLEDDQAGDLKELLEDKTIPLFRIRVERRSDRQVAATNRR
jgi:hypothetical protein